MSLNIRVKKIRAALGLQRKEMAEIFEIHVNSYYNLENDETKGVSDKIKLILRENYKVNLNWLMTGKGEMFTRESLEDELKEINKNLMDIKNSLPTKDKD